jgi:histidinol phosphatase-like enzyme
MLKKSGVLLMESAIILDAKDTIIQTDYQKIYPTDRSTWNAFSVPAMLSLLKESYFEVESYNTIVKQDDQRGIGRVFFKAKPFSGINEHHYFPDFLLKNYFKEITG